jgi:hypothetical protein
MVVKRKGNTIGKRKFRSSATHTHMYVILMELLTRKKEKAKMDGDAG